jgi:uncharacterized protein with ATP-grasp and redox domains
VLERVEQLMAQLDWNLPPPVLGQQVHRLIRQRTRNPDPYAAVKAQLNQRATRLYPDWHRRFHQACPLLEAAVRMAVIGNLLDVGAKTQLDETAVLAAFEDALTAPLQGSVQTFAAAIRNARQILYLADNAGEIVFDRDLLSQLPSGSCTLAVRGGPVLNDATLADAETAGIADTCEIISNGSDAPGTVLADCSPAFLEHFRKADLIIAKGQANFESLDGCRQNIFFLFKVKCPVVARHIGHAVGTLVLHQNVPDAASRVAAPPQPTARELNSITDNDRERKDKVMAPMGDGTGPLGQGPGSGKGKGPCGRGQGRGWGGGRGQGGQGRGQGRGRGQGGMARPSAPTSNNPNENKPD